MNQQTVIFLGPQGSGKGTQTKLLRDFLAAHGEGVSHFTLGQSLRDFMQGAGHTQEIVAPSMNRGELQPLFLVATLFGEHLIKTIHTGAEHLLIDGLPREESQTPVLDTALKFYNRQNAAVLHVDISDDEAVTRLIARGRADDTEETIRKRLAWSRKNAEVLRRWFTATPGYSFIEIDGERMVEEIHQDILSKLSLA